ncbi:hypothetical protein CYLTODRAFT_419430 [Cylindrobasidium torrendii FP15055 ss-10]|uniref:Uncharacterized protein n=1 Tax=Cylindrobasidium torrendii FP15055 ss-10 TaxID=1314674 RepID=A0A0D7BKM5_9AGAR|nr:hypothetical protein CYLTODRAFT_419430 [Cylindrobasidium torrendii FP15055 ss-10]
MDRMDDEQQVCVPTNGSALPAAQVWQSLFGSYIFPHLGPTSGGTWGEVKKMLLIIRAEVPHLYRVHCWTNMLLVLNKNRAAKTEVAMVPYGASRAVSVLRCWNEWAKTMRAGDELRRCTCSNDFAFDEVNAAFKKDMTWGNMKQAMLDIQRRLHSIDFDKYCA